LPLKNGKSGKWTLPNWTTSRTPSTYVDLRPLASNFPEENSEQEKVFCVSILMQLEAASKAANKWKMSGNSGSLGVSTTNPINGKYEYSGLRNGISSRARKYRCFEKQGIYIILFLIIFLIF